MKLGSLSLETGESKECSSVRKLGVLENNSWTDRLRRSEEKQRYLSHNSQVLDNDIQTERRHSSDLGVCVGWWECVRLSDQRALLQGSCVPSVDEGEDDTRENNIITPARINKPVTVPHASHLFTSLDCQPRPPPPLQQPPLPSRPLPPPPLPPPPSHNHNTTTTISTTNHHKRRSDPLLLLHNGLQNLPGARGSSGGRLVSESSDKEKEGVDD
ncbi:hypothetical protein C0Q70_06084 [Pomacea canaliculata]|uniref:Uncharacterized protein n=1 Tax=Pomacea canaliculata TaxID=400727 RepID=A0A2T7PMZ8_POMCA|nr:hypothetical protein C0Q70_06084 [Pomacea canaliculata]